MSLLLRPTRCIPYLARAGTSRVLEVHYSRSLRCIALSSDKNKSLIKWSRAYSSKRLNSLQPLLSRLDEEVRRFGRITKKDIQALLIGIRTNDFTSAQSLLVIRCCGELVPEEIPEKRTQLVQQVWTALKDRNIPLDISHYNTLLRVYLENEHPFSPAEFLEELEKKGITPNRVTYQRLMWRYCVSGDVEGATRILEKMRELGFPVSEPVLNALVMGHAFHGDAAGARAVLDTMTGAGLQPSGHTYALLAGGHSRAGDLDGTKAVLKLAAERDIYLSDRDLMDVIESLAIGGRTDAIEDILDMMQKSIGYNQDASNLILRLINRGYDEAAIKVFKTLNESKAIDGKEPSIFRGAFFVKQLVFAGRTVDQLITLCQRLKDEDLVPAALTIAAGQVLLRGDAHLAKPLFSKMRQEGLPVRHHFYWPLLASAGRDGDEEALLDVLRTMMSEQLTPNVETLQFYVAPYLLSNNKPDAAILKLQGVNLTASRAARGVLLELLNAGEAREAARIALQYRPTGYLQVLQGPLLACLAKSKHIESFAKVLHIALSTIASDDAKLDAERERDRRGEVGSIVLGAIRALNDIQLIDRLLTALLERGIGITNRAAQRIEEFVGENMTSALSEKLAKLSSNDLEQAPAERYARGLTKLPAPALEKMLARAREQGKPTTQLIRQLIQAYIESEDDAKLTSFLEQLEAEQFVLTGGTLAQLIEFYSERDVDTALKYHKRLQEGEPDFPLNKYKMVKLVLGLVKADRIDRALEVMKSPKLENDTDTYVYNSLCWQVLNYLAENKEKKDVETVLEAMISNGIAQPSNTLLGALVKTHILRDDIDGALAEVERCCEKYRCTPWKGELMRRLIMSEDATRLQRLTDVSTAVHGEVNSLHDLVLALVECGRLRQARRVLETPGLHSRTLRLNYAAKKFMQEGKTDCLEGLMEATKELSNLDRSDIFYNLLVSYCRAEATDKALGLWTQLQEQDEVPTEKFLLFLAKYLRERNLPIPFVVPELKQSTQAKPEPEKIVKKQLKKPTESKQTTDAMSNRNPIIGQLVEAIKSNNSQVIPEIMEKLLQSDKLSRNQYCVVLESLMKHGMLAEAVKVLEVASERLLPVRTALVQVLLARAADSGAVPLVEKIGNTLTDKQKFQLRYDSKVTRAHLAGDSGVERLSRLRDELAAAADSEQARAVAAAFPRGAVLAAALDNPKIQLICEEIVDIAVKKGAHLPVNQMWQEYIIAGKENEANDLWERQVKHAPILLFKRIARAAEESKDTKLLRTLISHMKLHAATTPRNLASVYSTILLIESDTTAALGDLRDCLDAGVQLEQLDRQGLVILKKKVVESGADFPYHIPDDSSKRGQTPAASTASAAV